MAIYHSILAMWLRRKRRNNYENQSSITHFNLEDGDLALLAGAGIGSVGRDDAFREYGEISTRKEEEHGD